MASWGDDTARPYRRLVAVSAVLEFSVQRSLKIKYLPKTCQSWCLDYIFQGQSTWKQTRRLNTSGAASTLRIYLHFALILTPVLSIS